MARRASLNNTFTKGVLDPDLSERIDLKHHYDSLSDGLNLEVRPQGGIARRAGSVVNSDADIVAGGYSRRIRRRIEPVIVSAPAVTTFNGGTAANLFDQDAATLFTTSAVSGSYFVLAEIDLGIAREICFVDVIGFYCGGTPVDNALAIEYWNGSAWVEFSGILEPGAPVRKNIRNRGSALPVTVNLASTKHFELTGYPSVDEVQTSAAMSGQTVLVKDHNDPTKNGLYTIPATAIAWTRATSADTAAEILQAAYTIIGGVTNGGSTWVNTQNSIDDLNAFGTTSIITYALAPTAGRTRRFGQWPGGSGGVAVSSSVWRVVVKNGAGAGAVSISGLRFWQERRAVSVRRIFAFDRSPDNLYDLVLTDRNIDVFKRSSSGSRRYIASIAVPIASHQINEMSPIQSLDTMVLFHEDIPPVRIVRQGSDYEWNADVLPTYNVPALAPGTAFSGQQDEIQEVTLAGIVSGNAFFVWLGDAVAGPVAFTNAAALPGAIAAALNTLPGVDLPVATLIDATPRVQIQFTGQNAARAMPAVQLAMSGGNVIEPVHKVVRTGLAANGPYFGAKTGWPRCGFFVQGRILVAGFRAAPRSWGVSAVDAFNFKPTGSPLTADMAFFRTLETDQIETIQQVFVGRHLQLFTDSSEWYVESRTLDATQPANAVRATGQGIEANVRAVFAEGSTIIVQQGGRTVRDFLFDNVEQSYKAEPLSLLGPHLLTQVTDVAQRKARTTSEGNLIFFVNADGTVVLLSLLRSQDVIGMIPQQTDGSWRSICSHINGDVVYLVERTLASGSDIYLEVRDPSVLLDAAVICKPAAPFTTATGLSHLEGKEVWAYAGDQLCGPFTVTGGQITVDAADAAPVITVGLFPEVSGRLQKLRDKLQNDQPFRPPARIYESSLALEKTGQLQIRANGTDWREVPLMFMDGGTLDYGQIDSDGITPDKPLLQRLVTGEVLVENLRGWSKHPIYEFRQTIPAPLHIKAIRCEIAQKG